MQARSWCFTHNNYTQDDKTFWENFNCKYICFGEELAPSTGTPHIQGYIHFSSGTRFTTLKNKIPASVNIRPAKGTGEQNAHYCSKDGKFYERGERPHQGDRSDLDWVRNLALDSGMRAVVRTCSSQQIRVAEKFLTHCEEERWFKTHVSWYWGPTGTGKTRAAVARTEEFADDRWISKPGQLKWWDRYDGQKTVIIDDFRHTQCPFEVLLRILDCIPCSVEVKGGFRELVAERIIITCPKHPSVVYPPNGEDVSQLLRRIEVIEEFEPLKTSCDSATEVTGNTKAVTSTDIDEYLASLALVS